MRFKLPAFITSSPTSLASVPSSPELPPELPQKERLEQAFKDWQEAQGKRSIQVIAREHDISRSTLQD